MCVVCVVCVCVLSVCVCLCAYTNTNGTMNKCPDYHLVKCPTDIWFTLFSFTFISFVKVLLILGNFSIWSGVINNFLKESEVTCTANTNHRHDSGVIRDYGLSGCCYCGSLGLPLHKSDLYYH